jgi:hypothetical protein
VQSKRPSDVAAATVGGVVPLRYVARAGLLPELTRQTYDSLYKALREAILNSIDAGATSINIDLSAVETERTLTITDNGSGMVLDELRQSFMSLGGSRKFGMDDKFGRIGIGSLALMHYARRVEIETAQAGSPVVTKAIVSHPWALDQEQRAQSLNEMLAGKAWEESRTISRPRHYTTIRLCDVDDVLVGECSDVAAYYELVDQLRRILPLRWPPSDLSEALRRESADVDQIIAVHAAASCAEINLKSRWSSDSLTKRIYGEGGRREERWDGVPKGILREVVVDDPSGRRTITVAGYLLSQTRPAPYWAGITARVQNVAVEERTFFGLDRDPGFRKYITGEVWLTGDVDRSRLVNIDRASFSRESPDYRAVERCMQTEIAQFKRKFVQAPRRAKVALKRRLDQQVGLLQATQRLADAATRVADPDERGVNPFHTSNNGGIRRKRSRGLIEDLQDLGGIVAVMDIASPHPYRLKVAADGQRVLVEVDSSVAQPQIKLCGHTYGLALVEGSGADPPVLLKRRPREIVLNLGHPCFSGHPKRSAVETVIALELAYLMGAHDAGHLYDGVLMLLADA